MWCAMWCHCNFSSSKMTPTNWCNKICCRFHFFSSQKKHCTRGICCVLTIYACSGEIIDFPEKRALDVIRHSVFCKRENIFYLQIKFQIVLFRWEICSICKFLQIWRWLPGSPVPSYLETSSCCSPIAAALAVLYVDAIDCCLGCSPVMIIITWLFQHKNKMLKE